MSLTLEIVSRQSRALGKNRAKTFGQDGGTIGRSLESDWSLPDGQRFLSSRHASIDFRSGSYYIVDTSKNGVFINDADEPVGRGKPQRLFPGDRIRIGEYEMTVTIENVDDTRETLLSTSHVDPVDARQRVEAPDPTSQDLVEAHVITGVGIEMFIEEDDSEQLKPLYDKYRSGDSSSRIEAPLPASEAAAPAKAARAKATPAKTPSARSLSLAGPVSGRAEARPAGTGPLDAFFRGAGINAPNLSPQETERLLTQVGQVMRELVVGVIDCLHLRALQKAQLKQSNTTIQARENNRLKFSANFEEGFSRLFLDSSDQYADPVESVRGAFSDIKDHQRVLLKAMRAALEEYLERLEPEQIELRATNGRTGSLINAANKFKYWDLYKEVYSVLANGPADGMPQPFLEALASAYHEGTAATEKAPSGRSRREAG